MSGTIRSAGFRSLAGATRRHLQRDALCLAGLALILLGGCRDIPSTESIRAELERQIPAATFVREEHVHLGPFTMWLARQVLSMVGDEDAREAKGLVREIRNLEVATYRVESLPELANLHLLADLDERLAAHGWTTLVRVAEHDERTLILTHQLDGEIIDALVVVSLEPHELTVVSMDGRLDRVLALAVANDPRHLLGGGRSRATPTAAEASGGS